MKPSAKKKSLLKETERLRAIAYRHTDEGGAISADTLEKEKNALVRVRVLEDCLIIEEAMSLIIMDHLLQDSPKWKSIKYFGRIKKYRLLYDKVLAYVPPFQKLKMLEDILKVPRSIDKTVCRIFKLRNVLAHVFTIDYTKKSEVNYAGRSIFDIDNFESYAKDANQAIVYLVGKLKF